jgi:hypothetical protein
VPEHSGGGAIGGIELLGLVALIAIGRLPRRLVE